MPIRSCGSVTKKFRITYREAARLPGSESTARALPANRTPCVRDHILHTTGYRTVADHRPRGWRVGYLEIHELPNINKRGDISLEAGGDFTIEPGIYIPEQRWGSYRIRLF